MITYFFSNGDYWASESYSRFVFAVESEAKAKTKVRFEEIFRRHAGLTDSKKSKKNKFHSQENIMVSLTHASLLWLPSLTEKRSGKCIVERRCKHLKKKKKYNVYFCTYPLFLMWLLFVACVPAMHLCNLEVCQNYMD